MHNIKLIIHFQITIAVSDLSLSVASNVEKLDDKLGLHNATLVNLSDRQTEEFKRLRQWSEQDLASNEDSFVNETLPGIDEEWANDIREEIDQWKGSMFKIVKKRQLFV